MPSPTLSGLDDATFAENTVNAAPQIIDGDVTFFDSDGDFAGAVLTISGLLPEDRVSLFTGDGLFALDQGTGEISLFGQPIGYLSGGVGSTFTITFLTTTYSTIEVLMERLTYANVSNTPTATRTLTVEFTDAAGNDLLVIPVFQPWSGGFANPVETLTAGTYAEVDFVDLDGDGDLDAVIAGPPNIMPWYFENTGTAASPVWTERTGAANPLDNVLAIVGSPAFGDLDGDGDLDIVRGDVNGILQYHRNIGTAAAPVFEPTFNADDPVEQLPGGGSTSSPALADLDADGDLDIVVGYDNGTLRYFRNDGSPTAPSFTELSGGANPFILDVGFASTPALADIDEDGDLDLVVGAANGTLNYYENTGTAAAPVFTQRTGTANPFNGYDIGGYSAPAFADLDGDGDLDLVVDGAAGTLGYLRNATQSPLGWIVTVTAESDTIVGGGGNETLTGTPDGDLIQGLGGDDILDGGAGDDVMEGGGGADYLKGGAGADAMFGGTGNDTYIVDDAGDTTDEAGGDGTDLVWTQVSWTLGTALENLKLAAPGRAINGTGNDLANLITGNDFANTLLGLGGADTLIGGGGIDVLDGGDDGDSLDGGTQDDVLQGGLGADDLIGGAGHDRLDGGTGGDDMVGGAGNDTYIVDDLADTVTELAAGGTDHVEASVDWTLGDNVEHLTLTGSGDIDGAGNAARNTITGNTGANTISGGGEIDTLSGGDGDDHLLGDDGADLLSGGNDGDRLEGGLGNDALDGGAGDDLLEGGAGHDRLTGGSGADRFAFTDDDLTAVAVERDQIFDLSFADGDVIDLSAIDADTGLGGDQAFVWAAKFTKVAGQAVLKFAASTDVTTLELDVDGDGKADFRIAITGDVSGTTGNLSTGGGDTDGGWLL